MNDHALLRKYEPVIYYTQGELFFPCAVDGYARDCSLWMRDPNGHQVELLRPPALTLEGLASYDHIPVGHTLFMRYVQQPLDGLAYQQWRRREEMPRFHAPGRLARVGMVSRLLDSFFDLSLLVRGTVPGGTTACAEIQYRQMQEADPRYVYYGRVLREGGYIVLHYLFFYAMNHWRSTFYGVNDHEADWEQVFVYLADDNGEEPEPLWVAYAAHDFAGDDLRRRWDDPELQRYDETHPVIYAGAGSHASYFQPGEYLMRFQIEPLRPVRNALQNLRRQWAERTGQGSVDNMGRHVEHFFSIPFIDYARGDGERIGPGQAAEWTPVLLTRDADWVEKYRGLWGLDTKDPLSGERAPAGPKFNRDGTERLSWYNPLGWAGLHKVAPPREAAARLHVHLVSLERELAEIEKNIERERDNLRLLELEVHALHEAEYLEDLHDARLTTLIERESALNGLYQRRSELVETLRAARAHLQALNRGQPGDPQAHIRNKHLPEPPITRQGRIIEFWAAVSSGLLLVVFALSIIFVPGSLVVRVALVLGVFAVIEAALRGRITRVLLSTVTILALVSAAILAVQFFWWLVLLGLTAAARLLIGQNLNELRDR